MITESLPTREDGFLIRGEGREIVAVCAGGWPEPPTLHIGATTYTDPTLSTTTDTDDTATWSLTIAQVAALDESAGPASAVSHHITVGAGEAERSEVAGYLLIADKGTPGTGSQVGPLRVVVGPTGRSVESMTIDGAGHLLATLSGGTVIDGGPVPIPAELLTASDTAVAAASSASGSASTATTQAGVATTKAGEADAARTAAVVAKDAAVAAAATFDPRSITSAKDLGVYVPSPTAARRWHQIRTATLAGQRQCHIGWLGDSIGYGAAATGATQPKVGKTGAGLLRSSLARKYGSGGGGWTLCDNVRLFGSLADDPRFTLTGAITAQAFGPHTTACWRNQVLGGASHIQITDTCTEFWITTISGGSQMVVTIDGGSAITLLNSASLATASDIAPESGYHRNTAQNAHNVFKIPAGALGSHTLRIYPINSGSVFLVAVEGRIPTAGTFRVGNMSINGKALSTFLAYTGDGAAGSDGLYSGNLWLDTFNPDLLVLALGVNDWQSQTATATSKSRLETLIARQRATTTTAYGSVANGGDVVLLWNPVPDIATLGGGAYTLPSWTAYRDMLYEVATEQDVCLIDLGDQWGSFAQANAAGLYADSIHPSDAGYLDYTARVETALFMI